MFNHKKQKDDEIKKDFDLDEISMKMETMKSDLEQKPAMEEKIKLEKEKKKKDLEKKLPVATNQEVKNKLSFKAQESKQNRPKTKLASKYLPKTENKIISNSPFLEEESSSKDKEKKINTPNLNNFIKKEKELKRKPDQKIPKVNNTDFLNAKKSISAKKDLPISDKKELNWKLLTLTIIVFIIALGSGAYYYFFMLKDGNKTMSTSQEQTNEAINKEVEENNNTAIIEEANEGAVAGNLPESFKAIPILEIRNENLIETINTLENTDNKLSNGVIYQVEKNGQILTANQLLNEFSVALPITEMDLGEAWIFIKENQKQKKDIGLILAVKGNPTIISGSIKNLENTLIDKLGNIYINRNIPELSALPVFSASEVNENFRYYNFIPGDTSLSLDWGITSLSDNFPVLIFSTSLDATQVLLGNFSTNQ